MHLHINFYPRVFNLLLLLVWYLRTLSFRYCLTEAYHAPDYIQFPVFPADGGVSDITLYTDSQHPPVNPPSDVRVILLDGPEQLQARFFGALPADAGEAEERVRARMQSPEWGAMQAELAERYREVAHAWSLGVKKYPAVVFDDRDVVYGTTDVAEAAQLRAQEGVQP